MAHLAKDQQAAVLCLPWSAGDSCAFLIMLKKQDSRVTVAAGSPLGADLKSYRIDL